MKVLSSVLNSKEVGRIVEQLLYKTVGVKWERINRRRRRRKGKLKRR